MSSENRLFKTKALNAAAIVMSVAVLAGGCAKTKTGAESGVEVLPSTQMTDTSIVTGSVSTGTPSNQAALEKKDAYTLTAPAPLPQQSVAEKPKRKVVKTASLGNSAAASTRSKTPGTYSLSFPDEGYSLTGAESKKLSGYVNEMRKNNKRVKIIGIANLKKGDKNPGTLEKARLEAKRRAKATSVFLRVYGMRLDSMTVTTADEATRSGKNQRRVDIVTQ